MEKKEKLVGFLGAIIIHLIAGIIFMSVKISSLDIKSLKREYEILLDKIEIPEYMKILQNKTSNGSDESQKYDQEILNIARNLAEKPDVKINQEDYIDRVKEEMIKSGLLGPDNYIDEQKRLKAGRSNDGVDLEKEKEDEEKVRESNEMAARYSGPTRIYYNLPGRTHVYLPLPIYKCEDGGKVSLLIEVSPRGQVVKASVISAESTTTDPCLTETAVISALSSRFTSDAAATKNQTGTITYHFVPQWQLQD
jgi:hypothetical protein